MKIYKRCIRLGDTSCENMLIMEIRINIKRKLAKIRINYLFSNFYIEKISNKCVKMIQKAKFHKKLYFFKTYKKKDLCIYLFFRVVFIVVCRKLYESFKNQSKSFSILLGKY